MRRKDLAMTREATFALVDAKEYAVLCLTDPDGKDYGAVQPPNFGVLSKDLAIA